MRYLMMVIGVVLLLTGTVVAQDDTPRTAYDALDLSTPEAAVESFVEAFQQRDYPVVYWIFAPDAQLVPMRAMQMFDLAPLVAPDADMDAVMEDIPIMSEGLDAIEHDASLATFLFDDVMLAAEANDAFPVDLRGTVEIVGMEDSTTPDDEPAVDVTATVAGIDGEVVFRTVESISGRWRVLQVITPGGSDEELLWAVPGGD